MFHPIAPEVDINFYGSQAKENVGLDSDIGLLILVDKEKLSYDAEIFDALMMSSPRSSPYFSLTSASRL